jgi:hypothetical protein
MLFLLIRAINSPPLNKKKLKRNCLLQQVNEGNTKVEIEVTGRRGIRRRNLLLNLRKGEDTLI